MLEEAFRKAGSRDVQAEIVPSPSWRPKADDPPASRKSPSAPCIRSSRLSTPPPNRQPGGFLPPRGRRLSRMNVPFEVVEALPSKLRRIVILAQRCRPRITGAFGRLVTVGLGLLVFAVHSLGAEVFPERMCEKLPQVDPGVKAWVADVAPELAQVPVRELSEKTALEVFGRAAAAGWGASTCSRKTSFGGRASFTSPPTHSAPWTPRSTSTCSRSSAERTRRTGSSRRAASCGARKAPRVLRPRRYRVPE